MDCIRQNHTYKLEHTMFVIAIHLIIAVLHLEVAMRPKPFNQVPFPSVTEFQSVNLCIVPLLRTWKYNLIVFIFFFCIYFLPRQLPRSPQRKLRTRINTSHIVWGVSGQFGCLWRMPELILKRSCINLYLDKLMLQHVSPFGRQQLAEETIKNLIFNKYIFVLILGEKGGVRGRLKGRGGEVFFHVYGCLLIELYARR